MVSKQGVLGLYSGLSVTLLEIVPYAALQFGLYDLFTSAAAAARTKVCSGGGLHDGTGSVLVVPSGTAVSRGWYLETLGSGVAVELTVALRCRSGGMIAMRRAGG